MCPTYVILPRGCVCAFLFRFLFRFLAVVNKFRRYTSYPTNALFRILILGILYKFLSISLSNFMACQLSREKEFRQISLLFSFAVNHQVSGTIVKFTIRFPFRFLHLCVVCEWRNFMLHGALGTMATSGNFRHVKWLILCVPYPMIRLFGFKAFNYLFLLHQVRPMLLFRFANSLLTTCVLRLIVGLLSYVVCASKGSVSVVPYGVAILMGRVQLVTMPRLVRVLFNGVHGLTI